LSVTVKVLKVVKVLNFPGVRSGRYVAGTGINQRETAVLDTSGADFIPSTPDEAGARSDKHGTYRCSTAYGRGSL
jgi:hypothetical protein